MLEARRRGQGQGAAAELCNALLQRLQDAAQLAKAELQSGQAVLALLRIAANAWAVLETQERLDAGQPRAGCLDAGL